MLWRYSLVPQVILIGHQLCLSTPAVCTERITEGAQVAITGRDQKTLDQAVAELGPSTHGYRADITIAEDRKQLFATLAKDFGKLDIVFANAGISGRTPTGSADESVFENVIHTNLS